MAPRRRRWRRNATNHWKYMHGQKCLVPQRQHLVPGCHEMLIEGYEAAKAGAATPVLGATAPEDPVENWKVC